MPRLLPCAVKHRVKDPSQHHGRVFLVPYDQFANTHGLASRAPISMSAVLAGKTSKGGGI
jgi:hypothetical protein